MTNTNTTRTCPLCNRDIKLTAKGAFARHGHQSRAGSGGGGCSSWRNGLTSDRAIIEREIASEERSIPYYANLAVECDALLASGETRISKSAPAEHRRSVKRAEERIAKLRAQLAALPATE